MGQLEFDALTDRKNTINGFLEEMLRLWFETSNLQQEKERIDLQIRGKEDKQRRLVIQASEDLGYPDEQCYSEMLALLEGSLYFSENGILFRMQPHTEDKLIEFCPVQCYGNLSGKDAEKPCFTDGLED